MHLIYSTVFVFVDLEDIPSALTCPVWLWITWTGLKTWSGHAVRLNLRFDFRFKIRSKDLSVSQTTSIFHWISLSFCAHGGHYVFMRPPHMSSSRLCLSKESKNKRFNVSVHYFSSALEGGRDKSGCEVWDIRVAAGSIKPAVRGGIISRWRPKRSQVREREMEERRWKKMRIRTERQTERRRNRLVVNEEGDKVLTRWHLTGFGHPSDNFYNYSERGSSLCCNIFEYTENTLAKIDRLHLYLITSRSLNVMGFYLHHHSMSNTPSACAHLLYFVYCGFWYFLLSCSKLTLKCHVAFCGNQTVTSLVSTTMLEVDNAVF